MSSWQPGTSGNPAGRKVGSPATQARLLANAVVGRFKADFAKHGTAVIEQVRESNPVDYLKLAVALVPKQLMVDVDVSANGLAAFLSELAEAKIEGRTIDISPEPAAALPVTPADALADLMRADRIEVREIED